ncbi:MAG: hypothetical protein ABIJ08_01760 [Nanoarchaeota archaeon]
MYIRRREIRIGAENYIRPEFGWHDTPQKKKKTKMIEEAHIGLPLFDGVFVAGYHGDPVDYSRKQESDGLLEEELCDETDDVAQFVKAEFDEAQRRMFDLDLGSIYRRGLNRAHAMYSDADLTQVPDWTTNQLSKKIYGMDSGGSLAAHNMFDVPDDGKMTFREFVRNVMGWI